LIVSDPNRLRQIILNLLENAVKFTGLGQIMLRVAVVDAEWLEFEVSDTGMGIDAAEQDIVFEKYRVARPRNYGGTGLGLAICRGFVEAMGGTIRLHSELQKGSTFSIKIPLQVPRKRRATSEASTAEVVQPECRSLRILVAEDNKINQKVVRAMLHRIGHTVTLAENGQVAVEALKKNKFDLVLMDKMMPVMDGIEATKEIRKMGLSKDTLPIVGLTARFQHSELDYYLECGMNACVGKPVKLESLKRVIAEAANACASP
jgi:CheY-like chemotaxis protein